MSQCPNEDSQLYTLGLLERLRSECQALWGRSSEAYFHVDSLLRELANPNLHDIANMQTRIELWTPDGQHVRWAVAATANVTIAHAAFDAAVKNWPNERFTLRSGLMVIREYCPTPEQK